MEGKTDRFCSETIPMLWKPRLVPCLRDCALEGDPKYCDPHTGGHWETQAAGWPKFMEPRRLQAPAWHPAARGESHLPRHMAFSLRKKKKKSKNNRGLLGGTQVWQLIPNGLQALHSNTQMERCLFHFPFCDLIKGVWTELVAISLHCKSHDLFLSH